MIFCYLYESKNIGIFNDVVKNYEMYYQRISIIFDKLKIDFELVKGFFRDFLDKFIEYLQQVLMVLKVRGIKMFFLVGGFVELFIVQDILCGKFLYIKLIIFVDVGLIVLKGVVIFGYKFFFIGF